MPPVSLVPLGARQVQGYLGYPEGLGALDHPENPGLQGFLGFRGRLRCLPPRQVLDTQ